MSEESPLLQRIPPYIWAAIVLGVVALSSWAFGALTDFLNNQNKVKVANAPVHLILTGANKELPNISKMISSMAVDSRQERKLEISLAPNDDELTSVLASRKEWDFVILEISGRDLQNEPIARLEQLKRISSKCKARGARVVLLVLPIDESDKVVQDQSIKLKQEVISAISRKLAQRLGILIAPVSEGFVFAQEKAKENKLDENPSFINDLYDWTAAVSLYCVLSGHSPSELHEMKNLDTTKVILLDQTKHYINAQTIKQNQGYELGLEKSRLMPTNVIKSSKGKS